MRKVLLIALRRTFRSLRTLYILNRESVTSFHRSQFASLSIASAPQKVLLSMTMLFLGICAAIFVGGLKFAALVLAIKRTYH